MLSSCFFFSCYGDHRDLHSFPTRRSSDLGGSRPSWVARSMSCAMRSTSARSCRQVASSFIRSLARTSALYSSLWPSNRRSEEHTSELQSRQYLVCRLLLEKKKKKQQMEYI